MTRTYSITRSGPFGSVTTSSAPHEDYRGTNIVGLAMLTSLWGISYNLAILGKRKTRARVNGSTGFDISIRTTANLLLNNGLSRNGRTIDGGRLEVIHNRLEYVAELVPNDLTYSSSCCYPVSGGMDITYTGSLSGTGSITFNGCGSASVTYNGDVNEIEFYSCE